MAERDTQVGYKKNAYRLFVWYKNERRESM